jgi:hypothetical protein
MTYTPPSGNSANFSLQLYIPIGEGFSLLAYTPPAGDDANFSLLEYPKFDFNFTSDPAGNFFLGLGVSGKLGTPTSADPLGVNGIWQMRMTKRGKVPIKMKFYTPTNPQTVPQEANRAKFASAMSAWGSLSSGDKAVYNARAKKRNMFGWGLFIREYYQANP